MSKACSYYYQIIGQCSQITDNNAAIIAAHIQFICGILTGIAAIFAGWLAFRGAIKAGQKAYDAAKLQVEEDLREKQNIREAYNRRITLVLVELQANFITIIAGIRNLKDEPYPHPIPPYHLSSLEELDHSNWRDHALLPDNIAKQIYLLMTKLKNFRNFIDSSIKENYNMLTEVDHYNISSDTNEFQKTHNQEDVPPIYLKIEKQANGIQPIITAIINELNLIRS